jgi:MoxR-like ATPase
MVSKKIVKKRLKGSPKSKIKRRKPVKISKNKPKKAKPIKKHSEKIDPKLIKEIQKSNIKINEIKKEIKKVVVGQDKAINDLLACLISGGNALLEGVPGIAKTLIIKSLAQSVRCTSKRIQFTADLLPTDITGFTAYSRQKGFFVVKGPIFANFVLADEINRSPPKVQSALIEVMQEKQVTIGTKTYHLDAPFIIFATENPLENRGVYKLPEAQVDRFLFKIMLTYPSIEEEEGIMDSNVTLKKFEDYKIKPVASPTEILRMQELVKQIYVSPKIKNYIAKIVAQTRPAKGNDLKSAKHIEWGASPRASINLYVAARANALLANRAFVTPQDVKDIAYNVLRHRIILNYQGQISGVSTENIISDILNKVKVP